jgi:hypothetical protein
MAGYIRQRASQIVNNEDADANDVAAEFNQIQAAFNSSAGHKHDGTSAEGAPITVTGPNQEYVSTDVAYRPSTNNTRDLGTSGVRWKDGFFSGTVTANAFSGLASSATTLATPRTFTVGNTARTFNGSANVAWTLSEIGVGSGILTLATTGIATGSQTFNANQTGNSTFTVNVPGTNLSSTSSSISVTVASSTGGNVNLVAATTSNAGVMTAADKTKLNGIATGAQVNLPTNLSVTAGTTSGPTINSSTGSNVVIPSASTAASGVVTTGTQTFAGSKTFSSALTLSAQASTISHALRADRNILTGTGITGGGNLTVDRTLAIDIASQAEAQAGTNNTRVMTPLRVAQEISSLAPQLTQAQVENPASTVFGLVSGQRLSQVITSKDWVYINPVSTPSGTVSDVTGLPNGITELEMFFDGVSLSGTGNLLLQLGTSSFQTTGYTSVSAVAGSTVGGGDTTGLLIWVNTAVREAVGRISLIKTPNSNVWVSNHTVSIQSAFTATGGGRVSLSGPLNRTRLRSNMSDTFDNGSYFIRYR